MDKTGIKDKIHAAGFTQASLAKAIEVHPNTVNGWSTGRIKEPALLHRYLDLVISLKNIISIG